MKPIIATYSNESYVIEHECSFVYYSKQPFYLCSNPLKYTITIFYKDIKLIARPKK